jgi:hypothetical protein
LLIGSAEDGHSIAAMERTAGNFWKLSKPQGDLIELVAEAIRICKLPNWWHPETGGHDYVYQSLVGQRILSSTTVALLPVDASLSENSFDFLLQFR